MARQRKKPKEVKSLTHDKASRKNIPTAEYQSAMGEGKTKPIQVAYERRNRDLDPQLVWRGKDEKDASDLNVQAPPLYIQEKIHPKALIDDLLRASRKHAYDDGKTTLELFDDFNGIPRNVDKTEFYEHDQNWSNRMILGDSLQVMASLDKREGLNGQVQCIYIDPPYGIRFNSNFQWSATSREVKDGNVKHITREPEQVKAFRDTWHDGIHSYLTYLRDRLTVARDLLSESGSIFLQIGNENLHRAHALLDEVFGEENFVSIIQVQKTGSQEANMLGNTVDFIIWFAKSKEKAKYRQLYKARVSGHTSSDSYNQIELMDGTERRLSKDELARKVDIPEGRIFMFAPLTSDGRTSVDQTFNFCKKSYQPSSGHWKTSVSGLERLAKAGRIAARATTISYRRFLNDFPVVAINDRWESLQLGPQKIYVVQTSASVVDRCILMTTDPGDLVLDPTCGSGTTAYVAERRGRRWITIDTSRVALALARTRIMGARYPYYLLADSVDGQEKEAELSGTAQSSTSVYGDIRQGFVYERAQHITLNSISKNTEIDVIWDEWEKQLGPLRETLNAKLNKAWEECEIPRAPDSAWSADTKALHSEWLNVRKARQQEIDSSIEKKADIEYFYDRPCENKKIVRVAGPFTVESISPHRSLGVDENGELINNQRRGGGHRYTPGQSFPEMILENLKTAGVQQAHKEDKVSFTYLEHWPGKLICAQGCYPEKNTKRRAGIFIGPEFGTVQRGDLAEAARESAEAGFDVLISCAFNYEAHATEFKKFGRIPILKARMNADLHMAEDLKNTGSGNLFVIFGEPDIDLLTEKDGLLRVKLNGVDVFKPQTGEIVSDNVDDIACWFIDTDYNEESFFVRHAYFLGAKNSYKDLKATFKAEIDATAWKSIYSDISRSFDKPKSGRIAVKVINHLGDEVMKVFRVGDSDKDD